MPLVKGGFSHTNPSQAKVLILSAHIKMAVSSINLSTPLMTSPTVYPLTSLSPQLSASLKEDTDRRLQNIIGANITSRYASSASNLTDFRLAITDKDVKKDTSVPSDFSRLVPLTTYEAYRPWMAKFTERPCKLSEVENLFAPGLPSFLGVSSATSTTNPKHFARYVGSSILAHAVGNTPTIRTAGIYTVCYKDIVNVTTDSGEIAKKIPVCIASAGFTRHSEGWTIETDSTRMTSMGDYLFEEISADCGY